MGRDDKFMNIVDEAPSSSAYDMHRRRRSEYEHQKEPHVVLRPGFNRRQHIRMGPGCLMSCATACGMQCMAWQFVGTHNVSRNACPTYAHVLAVSHQTEPLPSRASPLKVAAQRDITDRALRHLHQVLPVAVGWLSRVTHHNRQRCLHAFLTNRASVAGTLKRRARCSAQDLFGCNVASCYSMRATRHACNRALFTLRVRVHVAESGSNPCDDNPYSSSSRGLRDSYHNKCQW